MTPGDRVKRIRDEAEGVWAQCGVTSWEREFLTSIEARDVLSDKQEAVLVEIEQKVFGTDD